MLSQEQGFYCPRGDFRRVLRGDKFTRRSNFLPILTAFASTRKVLNRRFPFFVQTLNDKPKHTTNFIGYAGRFLRRVSVSGRAQSDQKNSAPFSVKIFSIARLPRDERL